MLGRSLLRHVRRSKLGERVASSPYFPFNWRASLRLSRLLWLDCGHMRSAITGSSIDGDGNPVPWYTYPAIHYLRQLDVGDKTVFEYGCGNSTVYWSAVAREVVSVEDNRTWFDIMSARVPSNCRLRFEPDLTKFVEYIHSFAEPFDIIVVDGPARGSTRLKCSYAAIQHLRAGGLIILDNSDWLPQSARALRDSGLLQVDMTAFAPLSAHTQTTSLFFDRGFNMRARGIDQPHPGIGSRIQNWEARPEGPEPVVKWEGEVFAGITFDRMFTPASPDGPRTFRVIVYQSFSGPALAILDLDRQRVLLSWYELAEGRERALAPAHAEAQRISGMSWEELRALITTSRKRHYLL